MRMPNLIIVTAITSLLTGCSTCGQSSTQLASNYFQQQKVTATTQDNYAAKNPKSVALFTEENKPMSPYRVIGVASVSKHNLFGMKRHDKTVDEMMKNLAASIGGDGLIDISSNKENVRANIIQFQKIMI